MLARRTTEGAGPRPRLVGPRRLLWRRRGRVLRGRRTLGTMAGTRERRRNSRVAVENLLIITKLHGKAGESTLSITNIQLQCLR